MKDSFANLDLVADGFRVLFRGEWLFREPDAAPASSRWLVIQMREQLETWESVWQVSPAPPVFFRPALLADVAVAILARYDGDGEHAAMAAHDQTLGLQRLQRGANAGAADPEPIDHLALDKPRPWHEAKREDGLAQGLRAATRPGVVSWPHERSYTARMMPCGDDER